MKWVNASQRSRRWWTKKAAENPFNLISHPFVVGVIVIRFSFAFCEPSGKSSFRNFECIPSNRVSPLFFSRRKEKRIAEWNGYFFEGFNRRDIKNYYQSNCTIFTKQKTASSIGNSKSSCTAHELFNGDLL